MYLLEMEIFYDAVVAGWELEKTAEIVNKF